MHTPLQYPISLLKRPVWELHFLFHVKLNISTSTFVKTWNIGNVSFSTEWKTFENAWAECQQAGEMAQDPRCQGSLPMPTYVLRWQKSTSIFNGLNTFLQNISILFNWGSASKKAFQWKSFNSHRSKLVSSSWLIFFRKLSILIHPITTELGIGPEPFTSPHLFNHKISFHFQNCLFRYFTFPAKVPFSSALHTGTQI